MFSDVLVATIDQVITEWDKNGSGEDYVQQWVRIAFKLNDSASLIASVLQFYPITAKGLFLFFLPHVFLILFI